MQCPSNPTHSPSPHSPHTPVFAVHDETKQRCMTKARIQWTNAYVRWRLSDATSRHEKRPSLKLSLQGPNSVCGVDGQPVLLIKRSSGSSFTPADRQLSFNCPRYISVGVSLGSCLGMLPLSAWRSMGSCLLPGWRCAGACILQSFFFTMAKSGRSS